MARSHLSLFVSAAFAALMAGGANIAFSAEIQPGGEIGCDRPVSPVETGQAILKRYGPLARIVALADLEGETFPGLMLYPDDPELSLEIETDSDAYRGKVTGLNLREKNSRWTAFGLRVGMTLDEVTRANDGPLDLWGFQQFGRGGVYSVLGYFRPGKLAGGCRLLVVFTAPFGAVAMPGPLYGLDHIASDNPALIKVAPVVTELDVSWKSDEE